MKFFDINILFATDDINLQDKIKQKRALFKNLYLIDTDNFLGFYLNRNTAIDIIVVDLDPFFQRDEEIEFFKILPTYQERYFIFLAKNKRVYDSVLKQFSGGNSVVLFKPIKFSAVLDNVNLLCKIDGDKFINLSKNININLKNEQIFKDDMPIFLTNLEHRLMILLSHNIDKLTTFEMIEDVVYSENQISRVVMQNLVSKLRKKLELNIKSIRLKGYILYSFSS